MTAGHGKH